MTFTHADPGTAEERWQRWPGLTSLAPLGWMKTRHLVVVAAHPDDESLGAGGLIAQVAAGGARVDVVVATAGEASHPFSTTMSAPQLAALREHEVRAAVRVLAPAAQVHLLGLPDGRLGATVLPLADVLRRLVTAESCLVAPWQGDAHTDHEAAGAVCADIAAQVGARFLEYPIWAWHWASPGDPRLPWDQMRALPLTAAARTSKAAALATHVSQIRPLSAEVGDEALLAPSVLAHFERDVEIFVERQAAPVDPQSMTAKDFDSFYAGAGADPWGFTDRWYEQRKRAITLASLPRDRFGRVFEPGCSIGVLTEQLAPRCEQLLATDVAEAALDAARQRTARFEQVQIEHRSVPSQWPEGEFDLVVLSEVGYYCGSVDLARLVRLAAASLGTAGVLMACHWRHPVAGYPLSGDAVHAALREHSGLEVLLQHVEEDFLLEVLVPGPATSVARATGLAR